MPPRRRDTLPKTHRRTAGKPVVAPGQVRRLSRRDREAKRRRQLYWGMGIAGALIVIILAGSALNEYWLKPRHVLATVDGTDIRRRDYWKYRAVDLADQANQYAAIANSGFVDQNQAQQYLTLAQQASAEIDNVWGSTDLDEPTLQRMIDDQIYLKSLDEFGITISDQDVQDYIDQRFQAFDAPIFTPTPTPTLIPERAEWATQTAQAAVATEVIPDPTTSTNASPEAIASPEPVDPLATPVPSTPVVHEAASPVASPVMTTPQDALATPLASPAVIAAIESSPVAIGDASPEPATPIASPQVTMEPTATPNQEQARQTATANYNDYESAIFDRAHLSRSDYERLIARPQIARERIDEQLTMGIGQSAEQVHASHILVDTKDLADAIYADLIDGGDFAQAARDQSIDSGTAANGGDLGWFTRGQMVDPFEEAAFATPPGELSAPVQTEFGWHIIFVHERAQDRAMTDDQITQLRGTLVEEWIEGKRATLRIRSEIEPTATSPGPDNFVPPPDAPPLPTEVPPPTLAPEITPEPNSASPIAEPATPIASPSPMLASPVASPSP